MDYKKLVKDELTRHKIMEFFWFIPDKTMVKMLYKLKMKKNLDLKNPRTFNEKLQWLKVYDKNPQYSIMVDKCEVKGYVASIIGGEYIIPTIGIWDSIEDVKFDRLPNQFVLKCTHDSGGLVICKDKNDLDLPEAKKRIGRCMKINYYWSGREWPYKSVKPRIIAEKYLELDDPKCAEYKIFCFNGRVKYVLVCKGKAHVEGRTNDFYDVEFNHLDVVGSNPNAKETQDKPEVYDKLLGLAEKLAKDLPEIRVDFYVLENKIYFGELTFFHDGGFCKFTPEKWDEIWGSELLVCPEKGF